MRTITTGLLAGGGLGRALTQLRMLPLREQATTLQVLVLAAAVECAVRTLPLPLVARRLGVRLATGPAERPTAPGRGLSVADHRRVRAVHRVLRRWDAGSGPCLRQALVLGYVLRRHSPVLKLGVGRQDGQLCAHAWIEAAGVVIGADNRFRPLVSGTGGKAER